MDENFKRTRLTNGINVYHKEHAVGFTLVNIRVPIGTVHNGGVHPFGAAHFLEHVVFHRSKRFPELRSFDAYVGGKGGYINARTNLFSTYYWLSIPNDYLAVALEGLFSLIFQPLLIEEDIIRERGIVASERNERRWFPSSSEIGCYLATEWKDDRRVTLEQIFGSDEDHTRLTPEALQNFHANYFDPRIEVISVGGGSIQPLVEKLETLELRRHDLRKRYYAPRWANREYREVAFRDAGVFDLMWGGVIDKKTDIMTWRRLAFIFEYLTNNIHGPLYMWLREEKGWLYGIDSWSRSSLRAYDWMMTFPLTSHSSVDTVRKELPDRVRQALSDEKAIDFEVDRLLSSRCYWHETASSYLESAREDLDLWGRIVPLTDWVSILESCRDTGALLDIFDTYFADEVTSMMCVVPTGHPASSKGGEGELSLNIIPDERAA